MPKSLKGSHRSRLARILQEEGLVAVVARQTSGPVFQKWDKYDSRSSDPTEINWTEGLWERVLFRGEATSYKRWSARESRPVVRFLDRLHEQVSSSSSYAGAKKVLDKAATQAYQAVIKGSGERTWTQIADALEKVLGEFSMLTRRWDKIIANNFRRQVLWEAEERGRASQSAEALAAQEQREQDKEDRLRDAWRDGAREDRREKLKKHRLASTDEELEQALVELSNFTRSVGHSDTDQDLLATRLGVRVRGWRGRLNRGKLTDRDRVNIDTALAQVRRY